MKLKNLKENNLLQIIIIAIIFYVLINNLSILFKYTNKLVSIFMPFIIGLSIAFILNIIIDSLEKNIFKKNFKFKRAITTSIAIIILLTIIIFSFIIIAPQLFNSIENFSKRIPSAINYLNNRALEYSKTNKIFEKVLESVNEHFFSKSKEIITFFQDKLPNALMITFNFTTSIFSTAFNLVIGFIFSIYLVMQKEKILKYINKSLYAFLPIKTYKAIRKISFITNKVFANFILGQLVGVFILGFLCFIGMKLLGLPESLLVSFIVGITALIPMFGIFAGVLAGVLFIGIISPIKAIIFLIFFTVLIQIDANIIYPKIIGESIGSPPILVLISVTIGGSIFGIIGLVLAVPVTTVLYILFNELVNEKLKLKKR